MPTKWEYTKDYLNTKIFARFSPAVSIPDQDLRRISVPPYMAWYTNASSSVASMVAKVTKRYIFLLRK